MRKLKDILLKINLQKKKRTKEVILHCNFFFTILFYWLKRFLNYFKMIRKHLNQWNKIVKKKLQCSIAALVLFFYRFVLSGKLFDFLNCFLKYFKMMPKNLYLRENVWMWKLIFEWSQDAILQQERMRNRKVLIWKTNCMVNCRSKVFNEIKST